MKNTKKKRKEYKKIGVRIGMNMIRLRCDKR